MPQIITIPLPCNEDWNAMTAKEQGRHCDACAKTVIDFTTWQPQEILYYFKKNKNICGRFTVEQLNEPTPTDEDFVRELLYLPISTLKRIAAIFLFAFVIGASSCNENVQGQVPVKHPIENTNDQRNFPMLGGAIASPIDTTKKKPIIKKMGKPAVRNTLKGDVAVIEQKLMGEPIAIDQPAHLLGDTIITTKHKKLLICKPNNNNSQNFIVGKIAMPTIHNVGKD